jgi:hypothetical protein
MQPLRRLQGPKMFNLQARSTAYVVQVCFSKAPLWVRPTTATLNQFCPEGAETQKWSLSVRCTDRSKNTLIRRSSTGV